MSQACLDRRVSFWWFDLEVEIHLKELSRLILIQCCAGEREPIQQPSAAAGALRQVARKRPGSNEGPHQGERRRMGPITARLLLGQGGHH